MKYLMLWFALQQAVTKGPIRHGDFGDDLTADEITDVLYLAISCAQGDRVQLFDYDLDRIDRAVTAYQREVLRAKTMADLSEATRDYFDDLKYAKLQKPSRVFNDALTGKRRPWPSYCDKDDMYSDGGSRYERWYQRPTLQEYGRAIRVAADRWKVPATGMIMHAITESNLMHLLSMGNCRPLKNEDGSFQINPRTLAPLCEAPIRPDTKKAWTEGQPGIDYGAWQIAYSVATRGMTKVQRKAWLQKVSTISGGADIAGKWWHVAGGPRCAAAIDDGRWKRSCGDRPDFVNKPGETMEEGMTRWRKKVGAYLYCHSCRGSYRLFGYGVAYAGRKFETNSAHMDTWEDRIEPALRKVREKRLFGMAAPHIPYLPSMMP